MAQAHAPMLQGFQPPVGPQPMQSGMYAGNQVVLVMKEKVFSFGGDFTVETTEGQPVFQVTGKAFSMSNRKTFTAMSGKELFVLKKKVFSMRQSFTGESDEGFGFEVQGHFKLIGTSSTVNFKNAADGKMVELDVKGSWADRSASITIDGRPVANVSRQFFNARQLLGGQQTYYVTVAPGVDLSLIAGICVSLDERNENKN